jgi:hypothetical protein
MLCGVGLLALVSSARAAVIRSESLDDSYCGGPCVDLWKVRCLNSQTDRITARIRRTLPGASGVFEITTLGYAGAGLVGQADRELSKVDGSYSVPAYLTRPGAAPDAMKGLVVIERVSGDAESYDVEFSCSDVFVNLETGQPTVKLVRDE